MNTSEQLKAVAIRKAWIAEIGEENFNKISPDENGWYFYQLNEYRQLIKGFSPRDMQVEYNSRKQDNVNLIYFYRPKSLSGIEKNRGWTRIEPDGSNLPESGEYWVVDTLNGIRDYLYHAKDGGDIIFWKNQVTHFQLINKPQPPIF